jgi:hypothetical protein
LHLGRSNYWVKRTSKQAFLTWNEMLAKIDHNLNLKSAGSFFRYQHFPHKGYSANPFSSR